MVENISDALLKFGMKNLILEKGLENLQKSGIDIGYSKIKENDSIVDTELFEHEILCKAKKMADFYVVYYCLENSVRKLITDVLSEKHGSNWWEDKVPQDIKDQVKRKQKEELDTAVSIRSDDPLAYANFGELIPIFNKNWSDLKKMK